MTPFTSCALIRRDGETRFSRPRKERPHDATHARKSAARYWNRAAKSDLISVIVVREFNGAIEIAERKMGERDWTEYTASAREAVAQPHIAACMAEIGVTADAAPPPVPDVLIINGAVYRRDI